MNGPSFKALDFRLHLLPSAAVSGALPRGHAALAFVDVGVGFADRAAVVVAVGFSHDLLQCTVTLQLQYKPKGRMNIGRPRKRWRNQFHFEDQGTGNTPNPS